MSYYGQISRAHREIRQFSGDPLYLFYFLVFVTAAFESVGIMALMPLIEEQLSDNPEINLVNEILGTSLSKIQILLFFISCFFIKSVLLFLSLRYIAVIRGKYLYGLKVELFEAFYARSYKDYYKKDSGYVTNLINQEGNNSLSYFDGYTRYIKDIAATAVYVVASLYVAFYFGFLSVLVLAFIAILFINLNQKFHNLSLETVKAHSTLSSLVVEVFNSYKYLKATNNIKNFRETLYSKVSWLADIQRRRNIASAVSQSIKEPIVIIGLAFAIYISIEIFDETPASIFVSLILLYRAINCLIASQVSKQLMNSYNGSILLINEEIAKFTREVESYGHYRLDEIKDIELRNISFQYEGSNTSILENVSAKFERGKTYGIVGPSGSGKSTFVNLLTSLLKPSRGQVFVNGVEISTLDVYRYRDLIGYVTQETFLFDDSVIQNLSLGRLVELEKVYESATKFGLAEVFDSCDGGVTGRIGEGGNRLSGGQRQRLALLREVLFEKDLLVLDEGTSALDNESQNLVKRYLDQNKKSKITIAISHRKELLEDFDHIYELNNGRFECRK